MKCIVSKRVTQLRKRRFLSVLLMKCHMIFYHETMKRYTSRRYWLSSNTTKIDKNTLQMFDVCYLFTDIGSTCPSPKRVQGKLCELRVSILVPLENLIENKTVYIPFPCVDKYAACIMMVEPKK